MFSALVTPDAADGPVRAEALGGGVFLGSAAWWLLLSGAADLLRGRLEPRHLRWVNRGSGALLAGVRGLGTGGAGPRRDLSRPRPAAPRARKASGSD